MTKSEKIWLSIAILVLVAGVAIGAVFYFFGVKVISKGEAYGFHIGDSREKAYENAKALLAEKEITDIHTWPVNQFHRRFKSNEIPQQNNDPRWVMVVNPDWWNNTITVSFQDNLVTEIRRDKIYCELP